MPSPVDTSREAARSIAPSIRSIRSTVIRAIAAAGPNGLTCDEAEHALALTHQTCSARFNELARTGYIRPVGKRKTRSGRNAVVWVSTFAVEIGGPK